jgi:hypothetical protein
MDGVIKLSEVRPAALACKGVPPVLAEYQLNVPATVLPTERTTEPGPQLEPTVTVGAAGTGLTVATIGVRGVLSQLPLLKVT